VRERARRLLPEPLAGGPDAPGPPPEDDQALVALLLGVLADLESEAPPARRHPAAAPGLVEPLSARELDVLRLLADGRTNREIAERLIVAVGTVKTHVHNLCGKLDAPTRGRAVARARELGLLAPRAAPAP
jgi:DNA-binding NarL/FixJ family response regulator